MDQYSDCVYAIKADATSMDETKNVVSKTIEIFGKINVLVNNAASAKDGTIANISYNEWDYTINNVLYSCFNYTKEVSKFFIKSNNHIDKIDSSTNDNKNKNYITLKEFFDAFDNFFPDKYPTNTILKYLNKYST